MNDKLDDGVVDPMKRLIDNGYTHLLSTLNSGVNLLFWEIGTIINNTLKQNSFTANDLLSRLSSNLSPIFGDYLKLESLSVMKSFAENCSVSTIGQISDAINLEYIPYFLGLDGDKEWLYYNKLIQVHSLDPLGLKNEILAKAIDNKSIENVEELSRSDLKLLYRNSCQLYFGKTKADSFKKLFEPKNIGDKTVSTFISTQSTNESTMNIYRLIMEFQSETHYVLNMQFNMLMWSIGVEITRLSINLNIPILDCLNNCVLEWGHYFPSLFNKEELSYCIKLAKQYQKPSSFMEIAEIVSWPHIKVLLEINSIENRAIIAKQVLNNGMDVENLKRMISERSFDFENPSSSSFQITKGTSTTSETKTGNNVTVITEHLVTPILNPIHDINRNIYKIPEILNMLIRNTY